MKTKTTKTVFAILAILLISNYAVAGGVFDILRVDTSPRGMALGSFPIAVAHNDISALQINPAGLAQLDGIHGSASYADHALDLSSGKLIYGRPFYKGYSALSISYFNYGEFDRRIDFTTPSTGTFNASDFMITAGYGQKFVQNIHLGVSGKFISSKIEEYGSSALALDASALWRHEVNMVDVSFGVYNLGKQISEYNKSSENLPMTVRAGVSKRLAHLPLRLSGNAHFEQDEDIFFTGCGEFEVSPLLTIRGGYTTLADDFKVGGTQDSTAGLSAGIGIRHNNIRFDYGFSSQGGLGQIHRFSISF